MNWLVRLYPPSWRRRYGRELEQLVEDVPGRLAVTLDLLVGAAIAYRDVVAANRVLSTAGAFLHGLCVAVLLQAIVFVSAVLAGQGSSTPTELRVGPFDLATVVGIQPPALIREGEQLHAAIRFAQVALPLVAELLLLAMLFVALLAVLAAPRALRSLR